MTNCYSYLSLKRTTHGNSSCEQAKKTGNADQSFDIHAEQIVPGGVQHSAFQVDFQTKLMETKNCQGDEGVQSRVGTKARR